MDGKETVHELIPWMLLIRSYYNKEFSNYKEDDWQKLFAAFDLESTSNYPVVGEGYKALKETSEDERDKMRFDFNRLFVGPQSPYAPPYESCYLDPERTLMQMDTLKVRAFYKSAGLELEQKNKIADDFIVFELSFLIHVMTSDEIDDEKSDDFIERFLKKHLMKWIVPHVKEVSEHVTSPVCAAMNRILAGVYDGLVAAYITE